jgi:hypothetical protein
MSAPYTDQIWVKSEYKEIEKTFCDYFRSKDRSMRFCDLPSVSELKSRLVISDTIVKNFKYVFTGYEYWGRYFYKSEYQPQIPTKLFNCFINRTDPFRQSWFYQLVRQNLIDNGNVSFNLSYSMDDYPIKVSRDSSIKQKLDLYDWIFKRGLDIFEYEHDLMQSNVPFQNFTGDLDQAIVDSKISIVIETYFDDDERQGIAFSEKIFRQLQLPRPFVLFCSPGAVSVLRDVGFDVYDDYIDHSYDEYHNNTQKQMHLLEIVAEFENISYNTAILEDFEQRAQRNRDLLKHLRDKIPARFEEIRKELENQ